MRHLRGFGPDKHIKDSLVKYYKLQQRVLQNASLVASLPKEGKALLRVKLHCQRVNLQKRNTPDKAALKPTAAIEKKKTRRVAPTGLQRCSERYKTK